MGISAQYAEASLASPAVERTIQGPGRETVTWQESGTIVISVDLDPDREYLRDFPRLLVCLYAGEGKSSVTQISGPCELLYDCHMSYT